VRIEPGVQRNTRKSTWSAPSARPAAPPSRVPVRSVNTGADALLVDDMLASMSRNAEKGGSVSLLAARDFDAPSRSA
jgi:outer membrane protein assembly factor BamC